MAFVEPVAFQEDGLGDEPGATGRHPGLGRITRRARPEQWVPPTTHPCLEGQAREGTAWVPRVGLPLGGVARVRPAVR